MQEGLPHCRADQDSLVQCPQALRGTGGFPVRRRRFARDGGWRRQRYRYWSLPSECQAAHPRQGGGPHNSSRGRAAQRESTICDCAYGEYVQASSQQCFTCVARPKPADHSARKHATKEKKSEATGEANSRGSSRFSRGRGEEEGEY